MKTNIFTIYFFIFVCLTQSLFAQQLFLSSSFGGRYLLGGEIPQLNLPNTEGLLVRVGIGMEFQRKWAVQVGAEFSQRLMFPDATFTREITNGNGQVFQAGDPFFTRLKFEYVVIPVNLRWRFWEQKNYSLYALVGVNVHFPIPQTVPLIFIDLPYRIDYESIPERYATFSAGLGIEVPLAKQIVLQTEFALENTGNEGLLNLRGNMGLAYYLGKN
ncbi:MAG: outer membrane beta-barrel protein [Bacteroidota bacterium]